MVGFNASFSQFARLGADPVIWLGAGVIADLFITIGLTISLTTRKTSIDKATDDKVARILRLTIQTGALTMIFALADLILFLTSHTSLNFIPDFALSKLFTNSILCTLNARGGWDKTSGQYQDNALFARSELSDVRKQNVSSLPVPDVDAEAPVPSDDHETDTSIGHSNIGIMELQIHEPAHYGGIDTQRPSAPFRAARSYTSSPRGSSDSLPRVGSSEDIRWKRVGDRAYF